MKKIILSALVATTLLVAANNEYKYEITPLVGGVITEDKADIKNHSTLGLSLGINQNKSSILDQIEVGAFYTHNAKYNNRGLKTDITRLFVNGVKEYKMNDKLKLIALAGIGHEYLCKNIYGNQNVAFFNYGVGVKYLLNKAISLRADVRHLLKFNGKKDIIYTLGLAIPFGKVASPVSIKEVEDEKIIVAPVMEKVIKYDSDGDGVYDDIDKCPNTKLGVKVDMNGCTLLMKPAPLGIIFDTNSAVIKSNDNRQFSKYVNYLKIDNKAGVVVEGHTDSVGSMKYNQILSQKRANAAKNKLVDMGVEETRIQSIGYGETKPLAPNNTKANRQINRRVKAKIVR
jgi:OOP family OmpA-OmpF porin